MKWLNMAALLFILVGGLNWGLVAAGGYDTDFVAALFGGSESAGARLVYALVGLSAVWQLLPFFKSLFVGEVDAEGNELRPRRRR